MRVAMNLFVLHKLTELLPLQASLTSYETIGSGHINSTWLLSDSDKKFIVQKLNTEVFKQPNLLISNALVIEEHLRNKQMQANYPLEIVKHIQTTRDLFLTEIDNDSYRILNYIDNSYSEDVVKTAHQAEQAAFAFGVFANALKDVDVNELNTVIADFHNLTMRYQQLKTASENDAVNRVTQCKNEIAFCLSQTHLLAELEKAEKHLPLRVCHNDTKINNMLFCKTTHKAKAVIDLDTCMAGYWLYDFGDMVRTFCSPEPEDSTQLDNVFIRQDIFSAIVKGYVEPLKSSMSDGELESLLLGAKIMPLMLSIRFLTDYLNGDVYFKVNHARHNLERAQNQLALYKNIIKSEPWMYKALMS